METPRGRAKANRLARPQLYGELASRGAPCGPPPPPICKLASSSRTTFKSLRQKRRPTSLQRPRSPNGDRYRWPRRPTSLAAYIASTATAAQQGPVHGHGGLHCFTYTANLTATAAHNRVPAVQMISYHLCCLLTTEAAATTGMAATPQLQWPRAVLANNGHDYWPTIANYWPHIWPTLATC